MAKVAALFRYPVKSMMGESLAVATLGANGIAGDRAWAVRDEVRGGIRGAKRFAALMKCAARFVETPREGESVCAEITLPDGETFATSAPDASARLSRFLDAAVTLWPLLPPTALEHYRRGSPPSDDVVAELRRVFARAPGEPLPDLSGFPEFLRTYESPPGTYFDAYPILLATTSSLATLARLRPGARFDVRRFRPNVLIDSGDAEGFPENAWCGRRIRIGTAVLEVAMPCPRCVMTTLPFADLPADPGIMRTLVREASGNLGVYATPVDPGTLAVEDDVEVLA